MPVGINIEVRKLFSGYDDASLDDHDVPEGDRIPSLKSHREALEQEGGFLVEKVKVSK